MAVHIVKKSTLSPKLLKKFRQDEKLLYLCGAKPEERCRSGRSGRSRKPLYPYGYPGFESLSFRKKAALKAAFFCIRKDGMRTLEGSLPRSALRSRDSLSFRKKAAPAGCFFCIWKDGMRTLEGFVIAQRSAKQRLPVFPQISLIIKHLQNLHPILHPETAVILGVLLASNDTMF